MEADHEENQQENKISSPSPTSSSIFDSLSVRSCTGILHYAFDVNSKCHKNPRCYGISLLLQKAPRGTKYNRIKAVDEDDIVKSFHYTCAGRSIYYSTPNGSPIFIRGRGIILLPACRGIKYIVDERQSLSDDVRTGPNPVPEDDPDMIDLDFEHEIPYPHRWTYRPDNSESNFLDRFIRSSHLVASKVAHDLYWVSKTVKEAVDDLIKRNKKGRG